MLVEVKIGINCIGFLILLEFSGIKFTSSSYVISITRSPQPYIKGY